MSSKKLQERLKGCPPSFIKKLTEKQKRVVLLYTTEIKLKGVLRWKQRMARAGVSGVDLAEKIGKPATRISEWVQLKKEPTEENYYSVEDALYSLGA